MEKPTGMRTGDLINVLVADQKRPSLSIERRLAIAAAIGFAVAAAMFWFTIGPRDDIAAVAATPRFVFKIFESLLLAVGAAILILRLVRPGADTRKGVLAVAAVPVLLAGAVAIELMLVAPAQWGATLVGSNWLICLTVVPALSVPLLAAALFALRDGAPTRPRLAGGIAGMLAGGLAAALYATHCTDDSPLFVATWYSLAIAGVSLVGAAIGGRVLRW
jgi:hypothetical protein